MEGLPFAKTIQKTESILAIDLNFLEILNIRVTDFTDRELQSIATTVDDWSRK